MSRNEKPTRVPEAVFRQVDEMTAALVSAGLGDCVEITAFKPPEGANRIRRVSLYWNGDGDEADVARRVREALPGLKEVELHRWRARLD